MNKLLKDKIIVEIQYFRGCPNSEELINRVKIAIEGIKIDYKETLVEDNITAEMFKFRGSPTLLINNKYYEDLNEPKNPSLSCRFYHNALPTIEEIHNKILLQIKNSSNNEN